MRRIRHADKERPNPVVFPTQLRAWRMRRGFTDAASLARRLGVPASTITRLERGERSPSLAILCRISEALDVPLDFLVRTTTCATKYQFTKSDEREFARLRGALLGFSVRMSRGDLRESHKVLQELGLWLEHLTKRLRRRLAHGNGKTSLKRSSSA